jgi:uncharacterized cupredoxin-like copper-binding protein
MAKMALTRRMVLGAAAVGLTLAFSGASAFASDQVVQVSLWDKGADAADMTDAMMANGGKLKENPLTATMGINIDQREVAAGTVVFAVTNNSKDIIHEMIVSPLPKGTTELPYLKDENRVAEDEAGHLGEVSELDPGAKGALTLDLKPGDYILYCNIPGHFAGGMWTLLTVK